MILEIAEMGNFPVSLLESILIIIFGPAIYNRPIILYTLQIHITITSTSGNQIRHDHVIPVQATLHYHFLVFFGVNFPATLSIRAFTLAQFSEICFRFSAILSSTCDRRHQHNITMILYAIG